LSKAKKQFDNFNYNQGSYEGRDGLVYCRVSSVKQKNEGSGLESQEGRCLKELEYLKIPYLKTFPDSYSGGGDFMNRPAMREMLDYIDKNPHKKFLVVFDDLKRFARDVEFHLKLRSTFKVRNVMLKCLNYNFDESPEGRFSELIMAGQAELERHQNRRQVIQRQKSRLDLGYWAFASKKGYTMTHTAECGPLSIPNIQGLEMLKPALEGFANGTFITKVDACRFLLDKGFWTKQSAEKYIDKFTQILQDPFYAGFIEYPKWEVSRRLGRHQPLISLETYELNQKRLNKENVGQTIRVDTSEDFPMRGLLLCADCKIGHITAAWAKGRSKKHPYYFCQNKKCKSYQKSIRADEVNKQFLEILKQSVLRKEVSLLVKKVFEKVWSQEIVNFNEKNKKQKMNKNILESKINTLTDMMIRANSEIIKRVYEKQIESLGAEVETLEQCLNKSENINLDIPYQTALCKSIEILKNPYKIWESVDSKERHRLFYFIFDEKLLYSKELGYQTANIPCAVRLFEDFTTSSSLDVELGGIEPPCRKCVPRSLHV